MVTASELLKEQENKRKKKEKTFKKIYKNLEKRIIIANSANHNSIWFEIPEFILGVPIYNVIDCKDYIQTKLEKNEFSSKFFEPKYLSIDWSLPSN
tara:strand:+ start:604 stop:891 length:288 start_codon:yes stop_codon:yes gene_type:complete